MSLKPKLLTEETLNLTKNIVDDDILSKYDKIHLGFNGAPPPGAAGRVLLNPHSHTNDQKVKIEMLKFANGHRESRLWTVVLKYPISNWDRLMTWAKTHELVFDAMLYGNSGRNTLYKSFFHCFMTRDESCEYELTSDNFAGISKWQFKKGGVKIVKKDEEVVVVIKLLEAGFYELYHYVIVDPKDPQTGHSSSSEK